MKKSISVTVLVGLLFVSTALALEPGDTLWTRTYGGSNTDCAYSVQQTTDGGYILAGTTRSFTAGPYDFYVVKVDSNGDTLWTRTYGGDYDEEAWSVQQTTDGGYIVAGYTYSFGAGTWDGYLVKTDAVGDTSWTHTYGGADSDDALCVQQTTDGGYIVSGYTESFGAGNADAWLVKTDADGDTIWTRTFGDTSSEFGNSVRQTTDGGYIMAGRTGPVGAFDIYVVKTDADGNALWIRTYGGNGSDLDQSAQQTSDGGYILVGYTDSFGAGGCDFYLVKTDAVGDITWTRTYGGDSDDYGYDVQQTADGGYIVTGYTMSFGAGRFDVWLLRTDANGDSLWTRTYGGSRSDFGCAVQQTTDGGYVVAGRTDSFGAGRLDFWLLSIAGEHLPAVSIEIVPDNPPVTVPQGGSFGYTGTLTNNTEESQVVDAWTMAVGPQKDLYGPFKLKYDLALGPYETLSGHFSQYVPSRAPLGFYNYIAYCGDYPATVMDSSSFQVEVTAGPSGGATGWVLTGSFLEGESPEVPSQFALSGNYPNPFNASTVISFELPTDTHVKLEVYNISGQKVATLFDGKQEAGYRSVTWEDSEAASGVYFYKLTAGDFTEVKRMTLLR